MNGALPQSRFWHHQSAERSTKQSSMCAARHWTKRIRPSPPWSATACGYRVRRNRGGTAVCKASIATVLLAFGIVALFPGGTNAMIIPPAGRLPTLVIPAIETAALRRDVTVTRHVAVRHRGVTVRGRHVAVRHRGVTRTRHIAAGHRGVAVRTRHVAIRHRGVAARRTHVAVVRRGAAAVKSTGREAREAVGPATLLRRRL
jgi:hypothetical protein